MEVGGRYVMTYDIDFSYRLLVVIVKVLMKHGLILALETWFIIFLMAEI